MLARALIGEEVDDDRLDLILRALADRTRRALLARLAEGPARITDLAEPFDMSLVAVSKHLKVLERAELIERDIEGRVHQCSFQAAPLREVERWLDHYRVFWHGTLDALANHVEDEHDSSTEPKPEENADGGE
ncbi:MAG: metalloregulator ArsR/SmtB family transcription factor [Pseudomonadota bacterium]